ncbi:MAG: FtsH protease activity modulator HflK [Candidatus Peribacteria bacterium]|jgi:membrane protease subunit HflK|nr:FtsH protease activity modulator HflK [Candidatus Peribacteria bacterium]
MKQKLLNLLNFLGFQFEESKYNDEWELKGFKILPLNWIILCVAIYLAFGIVFGTFYNVGEKQNASVEHFGKYSHTINAGIGVKIPFITEIRKVNTKERHRWELGFRTTGPDIPDEDRPEESIMLTKGGHLGEVNWIIQYTINDPYNWLYQVKAPDLVLDLLSQSSMRLIVGQTTLDDILTTEKLAIQEKNKKLLQSYCDFIELDVTIDEVKLQDCAPPVPEVKAAYNQVMNSLKDQERFVKEANEYVNKVIPIAQGDSAETINKAIGYASERMNKAKGEVAKFTETYEAYKKDPITTRKKMWYQAQQEVLYGAKKTVIDNGNMLNIKNYGK